MRKNSLPLLVTIFCVQMSFGQIDLPPTQVYLLQMEKADSTFIFTKPQLLTSFNPGGYNNQPFFLTNQELLLTVGKEAEHQTDIYLLNLQRKSLLRLTKTPESEYSPKVTPDKLYFSVVRVETDAERTQRLWKYPLDRKDKGRPVFRFLRGIGYYHWLDAFRVALFNVAEVNFLSLGDLRDESTKHLAPNVGRCFATSPGGRLVFVHKITENNWVIKAMNPETLEVQVITPTIPGSEDFAIMPDGALLMGKGSRLFRFHPKEPGSWKEVAELKAIGITHITRLAASSDGKLALVNGG